MGGMCNSTTVGRDAVQFPHCTLHTARWGVQFPHCWAEAVHVDALSACSSGKEFSGDRGRLSVNPRQGNNDERPFLVLNYFSRELSCLHIGIQPGKPSLPCNLETAESDLPKKTFS